MNILYSSEEGLGALMGRNMRISGLWLVWAVATSLAGCYLLLQIGVSLFYQQKLFTVIFRLFNIQFLIYILLVSAFSIGSDRFCFAQNRIEFFSTEPTSLEKFLSDFVFVILSAADVFWWKHRSSPRGKPNTQKALLRRYCDYGFKKMLFFLTEICYTVCII